MYATVISLVVFGITQAILGMVWGLRLEGKVIAQDVQMGDNKELFLSKLEDIQSRLGRIERSMNGFLHKE